MGRLVDHLLYAHGNGLTYMKGLCVGVCVWLCVWNRLNTDGISCICLIVLLIQVKLTELLCSSVLLHVKQFGHNIK